MYAIVEDSGTQIKLAPGAMLDVDLREGAAEGSTITFDRVLAIKADGDAPATLGMPYLEGATVTAKSLARSRTRRSMSSSTSVARTIAARSAIVSGCCGFALRKSMRRLRRSLQRKLLPR